MIKASLNHIAITVSKEENLSFYKALGFVETQRNDRPEKQDTIIFMNGLGTTLEIFIDKHHEGHKETYGLRHIAFDVDNLQKTREELLQFNPKPINDKYNIFFVCDPDGQEIEFRQSKEAD